MGGKIEPMIMPIQNPSNPEIWHSDVRSSSKAVAYYYGEFNKTVSLWIMGNVKYLSLAEGSSIHSNVGSGSEFE